MTPGGLTLLMASLRQYPMGVTFEFLTFGRIGTPYYLWVFRASSFEPRILLVHTASNCVCNHPLESKSPNRGPQGFSNNIPHSIPRPQGIPRRPDFPHPRGPNTNLKLWSHQQAASQMKKKCLLNF